MQRVAGVMCNVGTRPVTCPENASGAAALPVPLIGLYDWGIPVTRTLQKGPIHLLFIKRKQTLAKEMSKGTFGLIIFSRNF